MSAPVIISIVGALLAIVTSIVTSAMVVGRHLGMITTTLAQHAAAHARHDASAVSQGQRLQELGERIADLRGELRGRGDLTGGHRAL